MKNSFLKIVFLLIIIAFVCSYVVSANGYYEYTLGRETTITNEKIAEFESLIQSGQALEEWEYLQEEKIDYTNRFSNMMYNISESSNKLFRNCLKKIFKKLGEVVMEDD